jgi:membrane-bound lytic murein transglycosylase D
MRIFVSAKRVFSGLKIIMTAIGWTVVISSCAANHSGGQTPGNTLGPGFPTGGQGGGNFRVPVFELPDRLDLCGEPVPLERREIWEMLDQEFTLSVYNYEQVTLWIKRANRYFPYVEMRLKERKMPDDIKYVAVVESALKTYAVSSARAAGPWQFMEKTAGCYGLRVNSHIDERLNFERATEAALDYLQHLYGVFGSWSLALAAYNCGEDRVSKNLAMQDIRTYYDLDLPLETERYIFRILSAKMILSNPDAYGYRVPEAGLYRPDVFDRLEIDIRNDLRLNVLARALGTTYKVIREMNPELKQDTLPAGAYRLKIPKGRTDRFNAGFDSIHTQKNDQ